MDIAEEFGGAERLAYFSQCEARAAQPKSFGGEWGVIDVYASETGDEVVAWWYQGCGTPEGIVAVGTDRPNNCGASDTTAVS